MTQDLRLDAVWAEQLDTKRVPMAAFLAERALAARATRFCAAAKEPTLEGGQTHTASPAPHRTFNDVQTQPQCHAQVVPVCIESTQAGPTTQGQPECHQLNDSW